MKSRLTSLALTLMLLVGILAACSVPPVAPDEPEPPASDEAATENDAQPLEPPPTPPPSRYNTKTAADTLVVGTSAMGGNFVYGWAGSSPDLSIKTLTGSTPFFYSTVYYTDNGRLAINPTIVRDVEVSEDEDGNKTYTWTIHDDLRWNNGVTITAKDYVASILFYSSPAFESLGGSSSIGEGLLGYDGYNSGLLIFTETEEQDGLLPDAGIHAFAGVQLLGDFQFSMTIDAQLLPYFWEYSYVVASPVYSSGWFPGIDIISDEYGTRFSSDISSAAGAVYSRERVAPTITCGPYSFISFNGSIVNLRRNPHFKADPYGGLPSFEFIIQMEVAPVANVSLVLSGDIDLSVGNFERAKIEAAIASEFATVHSYMRNGYGYISFPTDWGVTSDPNVRWAIAHMIDRNAIIEQVLEGYGSPIDAAFSEGQWTHQARRRALTNSLTHIYFNLETANGFLDLTQWVFESDGTTPFDPARANSQGTYMRHNREGEMLIVRHISAVPSVGAAIEAVTAQNSNLAGMRYEVTHADFSILNNHHHNGHLMPDSARTYNAFNLAADFPIVDDKYLLYHSNQAGTLMNSSHVRDGEIDRLTQAMRELSPDQADEYADLWVEFLVRWQEVLPQMPLYSNQLFDIHNSVVTQVPTTSFWHYQEAICTIAKH